VVFIYRILKDKGFIYRTRIYDIYRLECLGINQIEIINLAEENEEVIPEIKTAVSSFEHIQERFEAVRDIYESLFLNDEASFDY